ncbi:Gfo/Idh/MocA family protein [Rhizomonospora bruguierae]|uniref:Gfo/Idh/MocA family protein n=1 Tax=Rhizomonospora bruguierae TaxID=1581705 RepID=UPI001BCBD6F0|nr:Gfo/Idh/MocA family oxidoreductase [Micromonospora sp. NBRC 107566]
MRVGLIGVGRIGMVHAGTLAALPEVEPLFIADLDGRRAAVAAAGVGAVAAASVTDLFAARPDAVVVAAPTPEHDALIRAAVTAGIPVFCEKPIADEVAAARRLVVDLARARVPVQVGFQRRFDPGYQAIREAVGAGKLGWLHTLRACTSDPAPPHAGYIPTSGGIFHDCGVHDYDAIRYVTGREVVDVYATGSNRGARFFGEAGDVDTAAAVLTLDDGTLAVCTATRYNGAGYDVRLEVCGSAGTMVAGLDEHAPLPTAPPSPWPGGTPYPGFLARFSTAYEAEMRTFLAVAAGRVSNPCTPRDALRAMMIAEAATRSWRSGRRVAVAEVERARR